MYTYIRDPVACFLTNGNADETLQPFQGRLPQFRGILHGGRISLGKTNGPNARGPC